jgi:long-chain acyl-CoA synthetase
MYNDKEKTMYQYLKESFGDTSLERIIFYNTSINIAETLEAINGVCNYLYSEKVGAGESVGICLPNIPQAIFSFYGVNKAGCVANVIHPLISTKSLVKILEQTNTKILFLMDRFYAEHREALDEIDCKVIVCKASEYLSGAQKLIYQRLEPKGRASDIYFKDIIIDKQDRVARRGAADGRSIYLHSGGTTGEPKTVVLSDYAINYLSHTLIKMTEKDGHRYIPTESILVVLPLFHGFGLTICIHAALSLGRIVLMPSFNSHKACALMRKHKINYLAGVPNMFLKMMKERNFAGKHLKNINQVFCGGDKLDPEIKDRFDALLKKYGSRAEMIEGYGLTEVTTVCTMNLIGKTRRHSQGMPVDGVSIKIMNPDESEAPTGAEGEIYVASPAVMLGYLNDENTSKEVMQKDGEGKVWIKTGDIGKLDEDGYLYFTDRKKRLIKIAGFNVFPAEIEKVVDKMPEIARSCAVEGIYEGKPCVKLLIEMNKKFKYSPLIEQKIKLLIENEIIKYAVPRIIEVVDYFKLTQIGKVDFKYYEQVR